MTLVLTCLAQDFVVQVSDRRVRLRGERRAEDRANKAVFFGGYTTWAYTGLAYLDDKRTDEWLFELFEGVQNGLDELTQSLEEKAGAAIERYLDKPKDSHTYRTHGRHAFVGAGYVDPGDGTVPACIVVSNFGDMTQWKNEATENLTTTAYTINQGSVYRVLSAGAPLPDTILKSLTSALDKSVTRGSHVVAHDLALAVRTIAKTNKTVGKNIMCCVIPRAAVVSDTFGIHGAPVISRAGPTSHRGWFQPTAATMEHYYYWPETASPEYFIYYSPAYVAPGIFAIAGGAVGFGPSMDDYLNNGPFSDYRFEFE